jgi:mono/diheme cytochrome c family protein
MGTTWRWVKGISITLVVLLVLAGMACGAVFLAVEAAMQVPATALLATTRLPPGNAEEGARLARILGCRGCHGDDLGGGVFAEVPYAFRLVAPNLTHARHRYTDAHLLRLLRTGAKKDGRLALVMPNKAFQRLRDQDVADLIAYLRAVPEVATEHPPSEIRLLGRIGIVAGEYSLEDMHADPTESEPVRADRREADRGRYLVTVACTECHGMDLAGHPEEGTPGLVVAKAYTAEEFTRLMRTGTTRAGTESASGLMSEMGRKRFAALTDEEVAAIKAYLDRR